MLVVDLRCNLSLSRPTAPIPSTEWFSTSSTTHGLADHRVGTTGRKNEVEVWVFLVHNSMVADVLVGDTTGSQKVTWLLVDGSAAVNLPFLLAGIDIPNKSYPVADRDVAFERLGADLVRYRQRGRVVLMGDFNARVGQVSTVGRGTYRAVCGTDH